MLFFNKRGKGVAGIDKEKLPFHIAIIPDGNGRWAKRKGLPRSAGHRAGAESFRNIVKFCDRIGIKHLTFYAFSTENWSRPEKEVQALMELLLEYLRNAEKELKDTEIRIRVIGNIKGLNDELKEEISRVEKITEQRQGLNLIFAINYGGRDEIANALLNISLKVRDGYLKPEEINTDTVASHLYTKDIPDPDLIIRTSGEARSSNFLLWQSAYSEYYFSSVLWPDFKERHMLEALTDFQKRKRRYGGI